MSPEEQKRLRFQGRARSAGELAAVMRTGAMTAEVAEIYAAGLVDGIADFLTAYFGKRAAYDVLQAAADAAAAGAPVRPDA